ncbi:hypothetical protein BDZ97DRAFT_1294508 [Flammula alnicola]|nr:hypothetical protein BDZ97DRAFT_1294508 [Flammula alnicola]
MFKRSLLQAGMQQYTTSRRSRRRRHHLALADNAQMIKLLVRVPESDSPPPVSVSCYKYQLDMAEPIAQSSGRVLTTKLFFNRNTKRRSPRHAPYLFLSQLRLRNSFKLMANDISNGILRHGVSFRLLISTLQFNRFQCSLVVLLSFLLMRPCSICCTQQKR